MEVKKAIIQKELPFWKRALRSSAWGIITAICFTYFISQLGIYTSGVSLTINGVVAMMETLGWITLDQRALYYWTIYTLFTIGLMIFTFKKIGKTYAYLTLFYLTFNIVTGFVMSLAPMFTGYQLFEPNALASVGRTFDFTNSTVLTDADVNNDVFYIFDGAMHPGDVSGAKDGNFNSNDLGWYLNKQSITDDLSNVATIFVQGHGHAIDKMGWDFYETISLTIALDNGDAFEFYITNVVYNDFGSYEAIGLNMPHTGLESKPGRTMTATTGFNISEYAIGQTIIAALMYAIIQSIALGSLFNMGGSSGGIDPIAYYISMTSPSAKNISFYTLVWSASNIIFFVVVNDWLLFDFVRAPETLEPVHGFMGSVFGAPMIASFTYLSILTVYVGMLYPRGKNVEVEISTRKSTEIQNELIYQKWGRSFTVRTVQLGLQNPDQPSESTVSIISIVCNLQEEYDIMKLVNFVDENAMITVKPLNNVYSAQYSSNIGRIQFDYEHIKATFAQNAAKYEETVKETNRVEFFDRVAMFFNNKKRQEEKKKKQTKDPNKLTKDQIKASNLTQQIESNSTDLPNEVPSAEQVEEYVDSSAKKTTKKTPAKPAAKKTTTKPKSKTTKDE